MLDAAGALTCFPFCEHPHDETVYWNLEKRIPMMMIYFLLPS